MRIALVALSFLSLAPLAHAGANGDHPAIVARRVIAAQGYDYAAAFYRHPAGLELTKAPSQPTEQAEAVLAKRTPGGHHGAHRAPSRK